MHLELSSTKWCRGFIRLSKQYVDWVRLRPSAIVCKTISGNSFPRSFQVIVPFLFPPAPSPVPFCQVFQVFSCLGGWTHCCTFRTH